MARWQVRVSASWYNAPPAQVFMGDVGSLAIGGAMGTVAVLTKQEFMLLMVGGCL